MKHDAVSDPDWTNGAGSATRRLGRPHGAEPAAGSTCVSSPHNKLLTPDTAVVDVAHAAAHLQVDQPPQTEHEDGRPGRTYRSCRCSRALAESQRRPWDAAADDL